MHEGAIAAAIIQGALEVLEKEKIAAAKTVTVLIGRLHHVVPEVLQNHYQTAEKRIPGPEPLQAGRSRSRRCASPAAPAARRP